MDLKKHTNDLTMEGHLGLEISEILWSFYLLQKLPAEPESDDAYENMKRLRFAQLLINDVILRLCKLREDNPNSICFPQVLKTLKKRVASKERAELLKTEVKRYTTLTQNLERHRNTYIAHLSKKGKGHLKPPTQMLEAVTLAVRITDVLSGGKNSYRFLDVDIRKTVLRETDKPH
jgi:hypothetical protein